MYMVVGFVVVVLVLVFCFSGVYFFMENSEDNCC